MSGSKSKLSRAVGLTALVASGVALLPDTAHAQARDSDSSSIRADRPVRAGVLLNLRSARVQFNNVAIADAFEYLRETTGLNLYVNWAALELAGVDRSAAVTLDLRGVSHRKLLDLLLDTVAPGQLAWYVDDNVVHVTTIELSNNVMITRIYPVQDLLVEVPNFEGPRFSLNVGSGNGGGSSFNASGSGNENEPQSSMAERAEQLVEMIQVIVEPDAWRDNGGFSTIRYFMGNLIVTAPRSVHEKLARQPGG